MPELGGNMAILLFGLLWLAFLFDTLLYFRYKVDINQFTKVIDREMVYLENTL